MSKATLYMIQLPLNCDVTYFDHFLSETESKQLYDLLKERITLESQVLKLPNGEELILDSPKTQFASKTLIDSGKIHEAQGEIHEIFPELDQLRIKLEELTQFELDVCVAIYYKSGLNGVDYHSDYTAFGDTSCIPSISLGAARTFSLREIESPNNTYDIALQNGSLIVMGENCQELYEHALLTDSSVDSDRINLTFRKCGY